MPCWFAYLTGATLSNHARLAQSLDEQNPGASAALEEALTPMGYTLDDLAGRLRETIPHLISLPYRCLKISLHPPPPLSRLSLVPRLSAGCLLSLP